MSSTNPETTSSKRKAPDDRVASKAAATQAIHFTARNPPWTYLKILPEAPQPKPTDKFIWLRVPRQDAPAVVAAVSSWIGGGTGGGSVGSVAWRVCAKGNYLGALTQGSGEDLFAP